MLETWTDIEGLLGRYKVSSLGRVLSFIRYKEGRILAQRVSNDGYLFIGLYDGDKQKTYLIHRLIAIHFIDNPEGLLQVNHINGDRRDNRLENLEWCSIRENLCHRSKRKSKSSKYTGVAWNKHSKKWNATIHINKKLCNLGYYENEEDAYNARVKFEIDNNIQNKYLIL